MLTLFLCTCIIPFFTLIKISYSPLFRFALRLILVIGVGFILFSYESLLIQIVIIVSMMIMVSLISNAMSSESGVLDAFCFVMLVVNLFLGLFSNNGSIFVGHEYVFAISMIISLFSILAYFLISSVDSIRWFNKSRLQIPATMRRSSILLLVGIGFIFAILASISWIARVFDMIISSIIELIRSLHNFITNALQNLIPEQSYQPPMPDALPMFPEIYESAEESGVIHIIANILFWILVIALVVSITVSLVLLFIRVLKLIQRYIKTWKPADMLENDVFTEVVEKSVFIRKATKLRRYERKPRYSSLMTERERILFIYHEYVRRAKRNKLTIDNFSDTPSEVLEEIAGNVKEKAFPEPKGLSTAYNIARYSNDFSDVADSAELKRRLL